MKPNETTDTDTDYGGERRLLATLEQLLAIEATDVKTALDQASQLVGEGLGADKIDTFLYDSAIDSLVAVGTSTTPMAARQRQLGLDRVPITNGGRAVDVFQTGQPYHTGHSENDSHELRGMVEGLGAHSNMYVPLDVDGQRRGALGASAAHPERFASADLHFLQAVARWVGGLIHRVELVERITRETAIQARHQTAEELLATLAHDLRNYLTPLAGRIDMLRISAQRDGRAPDLRNADAAAHALGRLRHMITDMLDAARLEQGIFALAREPMNVAELARATADVLRPREGAIRVEAPHELLVYADADRLRQALENLVSNALKYSPASVPVVVQVAREEDENGAWAVLHIRDDGPGIAAELLPQLFTRFVRGNESTGLGLGLYLARGIAEAHGGALTAESAPGAGTLFRMALPLQAHDTAG